MAPPTFFHNEMGILIQICLYKQLKFLGDAAVHELFGEGPDGAAERREVFVVDRDVFGLGLKASLTFIVITACAKMGESVELFGLGDGENGEHPVDFIFVGMVGVIAKKGVGKNSREGVVPKDSFNLVIFFKSDDFQ